MDDIELFKKIHITSSLDERQLMELRKILTFIKIKAGETIVNEGEAGDTMYFFIKGSVQISQQITLKVTGGKWSEAEKSIANLDSDTIGFFGEMSLVSGEPRSATIKAITDCELYEIKKSDFDVFAKKEAEAAYKILKEISAVLSKRVSTMNGNILKLTTALSIALSKKKKNGE